MHRSPVIRADSFPSLESADRVSPEPTESDIDGAPTAEC